MDSRLASYYGLREQPFGETPDPRYLFLSETHREALASLMYRIEEGRGFLALVAPPGMGKTTLLFHLQQWLLRKNARTAFIFDTQCGEREFMQYLLAEFGIESGATDAFAMHQRLNEFLVAETGAGRRCVVIIDEAHNLDERVLETVRLLSDFETESRKLIQIVLTGQPQLVEKLTLPCLLQLRQRISIYARLQALGPFEVGEYIAHRLRCAGGSAVGLFTPGALASIARHSMGVPRTINNICFHALSLAIANKVRFVDKRVVEEVVGDLAATPATMRRGITKKKVFSIARQSRRRGAAMLVALMLLLVSCAAVYLGRSGSRRDASNAERNNAARVATANNMVAGSAGELAWQSPPLLATAATAYVVTEGDTLYSILRRVYGHSDGKLVGKVAALNPQLSDPDRIAVGQRLRLP